MDEEQACWDAISQARLARVGGSDSEAKEQEPRGEYRKELIKRIYGIEVEERRGWRFGKE